MRNSYEQILAAVREQSAFVFVDVKAPRDAPTKQFVASLFEETDTNHRPLRPQGQATSIAITPEQARELLAAGAEWKGPTHLRAEVLPGV